MSRYIQALNVIKQNITQLSLTPGQASCRIQILERLEYPGVINLYGGHGSGKTALGWCLASEGHAIYIVEPSLLQSAVGNASFVFIDNASHHHDEYRHILDQLAYIKIRQAVVVSNERIDDYVQSIAITCTHADIKIAMNNLSLLGFTPPSPSDTSLFGDLWDVLHVNARSSQYA